MEIGKHKIVKYKKLTKKDLEEFLVSLSYVKSSERRIVCYTGQYGMISFDFAMLGLELNIKLGTPIIVRRGMYRYQINLFEKHGLYKMYVKDAIYYLFKGTNLLGKSKNSKYLLRKLKNYENKNTF